MHEIPVMLGVQHWQPSPRPSSPAAAAATAQHGQHTGRPWCATGAQHSVTAHPICARHSPWAASSQEQNPSSHAAPLPCLTAPTGRCGRQSDRDGGTGGQRSHTAERGSCSGGGRRCHTLQRVAANEQSGAVLKVRATALPCPLYSPAPHPAAFPPCLHTASPLAPAVPAAGARAMRASLALLLLAACACLLGGAQGRALKDTTGQACLDGFKSWLVTPCTPTTDGDTAACCAPLVALGPSCWVEVLNTVSDDKPTLAAV